LSSLHRSPSGSGGHVYLRGAVRQDQIDAALSPVPTIPGACASTVQADSAVPQTVHDFPVPSEDCAQTGDKPEVTETEKDKEDK